VPTLSWSGKHLRADCSICCHYVKFVPQSGPWLDMAPRRPGPPFEDDEDAEEAA